jgi:hypothetical protein
MRFAEPIGFGSSVIQPGQFGQYCDPEILREGHLERVAR